MSKQAHTIEVVPPRFQEIRENMAFRGYRCPKCNGRGGFSEKTGFNEHSTKECDYCEGTGKVKAEVQINWKPDFD